MKTYILFILTLSFSLNASEKPEMDLHRLAIKIQTELESKYNILLEEKETAPIERLCAYAAEFESILEFGQLIFKISKIHEETQQFPGSFAEHLLRISAWNGQRLGNLCKKKEPLSFNFTKRERLIEEMKAKEEILLNLSGMRDSINGTRCTVYFRGCPF